MPTPRRPGGVLEKKFQDNRARDSRNRQLLEDLGWNILYVWECEVKHPQPLAEKLDLFLQTVLSEGGVPRQPPAAVNLKRRETESA